MALLNSQSYGSLASVSGVQRERYVGKFLPVFITGEMRENQEIGKLQCMPEIGSNKYVYHDCSELFFIPLFIKRVWEKYIESTNQKGERFDQLVAFGGWNDEQKIDDQCRYVYYVAGFGLDQQTKKVKLHEEDIEASKTKKGDKVLIYFRCGATKFQGAMNLMDEFSKKSKELPPLSDNAEFEKNVVTPRRFIIKTVVGTQKTENYGNKAVFKFEPVIMIPDNSVENIMKSAIELTPDFEKQFKETKENQIRKFSAPSEVSKEDSDKLKFENTSSNKEEKNEDVNSDVPKDDFNLGI